MPANHCEGVVFADKAYLAVVAETYEKIGTETGGILLGKQMGSVWYVLEALDPGPNSIFRPAYFEYDTPYVTHLANKTARLYKNNIELLGLWHRHPGSFDAFSSTDDGTNTKYAAQRESGAISGLVNLDPQFRLTMYHIALPLRYTKVSVHIGDALIPQDMFAMKSLTDFLPQIKRVSERVRFKEFFRGQISQRAQEASEANPASARFREAALDLLEHELSYLESQEDYDYTITLDDHEVVLSMTYTQHMPYYPKKLQFVLGVSAINAPYVRINGHQYGYKPNIIRTYINQLVEKAMERLGSPPHDPLR